MIKFPTRKRNIATQDPSPQQLFDKAVADKDYSRKACLRTYSSRTIIVTGSDAGKELARPPGAQDEEKVEGGRWGNPFSGRGSKTRQSQSTPTPAPPSATVPSYITGGITWVEPGLWNGTKAHFVLLHFEHKRQEDIYLERVELDIRVWQAGDAVKSMAQYSHRPLAGVLPPLAEDLADNAPPIVFYAPRSVVGRPADHPHREYYWSGEFQEGDTFRYAGDLHAPQELGDAGSKETDPQSLLHIDAYGNLRDRLPPPDFSVALVVLSNGKPFDLTAYDGTFHWHLRPLRHWLWSPYRPARFCKSAKLRPKGQKPIRCDFASVEMRTKIQELVQWCQPFDTIWFGSDKGCVHREPGDTRGCSRNECALCRGRC